MINFFYLPQNLADWFFSFLCLPSKDDRNYTGKIFFKLSTLLFYSMFTVRHKFYLFISN